jgi:hypothetical protein
MPHVYKNWKNKERKMSNVGERIKLSFMYDKAYEARRIEGEKFIPYQWQRAIEEGWEIKKFSKMGDFGRHYVWWKPTERGLECVGPVNSVDLKYFGFEKPSQSLLGKEVDLLNHYLHPIEPLVSSMGENGRSIDLQCRFVLALLLELGFI